MDALETVKVGDLTVKLYQDEEPSDPREDDNLGTMVCFHRRYKLGDKHEYKSPAEFAEFLETNKDEIAVVLPLYLYDHSGITMNTTGFHCPWDSGQVGYIYITKEKVKEEYGDKADLEKVTEYLEGEVATYDQFLRGDVYAYVVEDADGENLDSCCGFYGLEYAKEEALGVAKYQLERRAEEEKKIDSVYAH